MKFPQAVFISFIYRHTTSLILTFSIGFLKYSREMNSTRSLKAGSSLLLRSARVGGLRAFSDTYSLHSLLSSVAHVRLISECVYICAVTVHCVPDSASKNNSATCSSPLIFLVNIFHFAS